MKKTFSAVVHKEDDMFVEECPEVGTASQGYTLDEALANLKEATELYLEECSAWHYIDIKRHAALIVPRKI